MCKAQHGYVGKKQLRFLNASKVGQAYHFGLSLPELENCALYCCITQGPNCIVSANIN
jgi:hypothetical protein